MSIVRDSSPGEEVTLPLAGVTLAGLLSVPEPARGLIVFVHGSGSSRFSPRNRAVAGYLNARGFATLLMDLLTPEEEAIDEETRALRFDIERLSGRVIEAVRWLGRQRALKSLPIGLFGASTGAAAALVTAAALPDRVRAVVSRGGRPDLAGEALPAVHAPTLLIVGGRDPEVLELNREAMALMAAATTDLQIVPGATHLFEEPGALEAVAQQAAGWFERYLG